MKYTGQKMSLEASMLPESLQAWLGHELEIRGIDAVIYTRYILSILQQDSFDADVEMAEGPFHPMRHELIGRGCARKIAEKWKINSGGCVQLDSEERKKSAAVQCLLSVSDEDLGIKSLVDELYLKVKEQESSRDFNSRSVKSSSCDQSEGSDSDSTTEDPAERYYAAFPPLSDRCGTACLPQPHTTDGHLWAQVAQKSFSKSEKLNDDSGIDDQLVCDPADNTIENKVDQEGKNNSYRPKSKELENDEGIDQRKETLQERPVDGKREPLRPAHMISKAQIYFKYQDKQGKEKSNARIVREGRSNLKEGHSKEERSKGDRFSKGLNSVGRSDGKSKVLKVKPSGQEKNRSGENKENRSDDRRVSPQGLAGSRKWTDFELPQPTFIVPKVKPSLKAYKDNLRDVSPSAESSHQRNPGIKPFDAILQQGGCLTFQEQKEQAEKMREINLVLTEGSEPSSKVSSAVDELEVQRIFRQNIKSQQQYPEENWMWYTEPLEALVPPSPVPSQRLYKRHSPSGELLDFDFSHIFSLSEIATDENDFVVVGSCEASNISVDNLDFMPSGVASVAGNDIDESLLKDRCGEVVGYKETSWEALESIEDNQIGILGASFQEDLSPGICTCISDSDDDGTTYLREINLYMDNSCSGSNSSQGSRVFTPESTENQVLDDRPVFELGQNLEDLFTQAVVESDLTKSFTSIDTDNGVVVSELLAQTEPTLMSELCSDKEEQEDTSLVSQLLLSIQTDMFPSSWPESSDEDTLTASFSTTTWQSDTSEMERSFDSLCGRIHSLCLKELGDSGSSDVFQSPELQILTCDSCVSNNNINSDLCLGAGSCSWTFFSGMPKTSIWSAYLDCESPAFVENHGFSWQQIHATNSTFDDDRPWEFFSSPLTLHLSPKGSGTQTSQLWDVNVQRKVTFMTPDCSGERPSTTENIHKYLWNLRFGLPGEAGFTESQDFIRGGLYGNSLLGLQDSIWDHSHPGSPRKSTLSSDTMDDVFGDLEDPEHLWDNFSAHPSFFKQRSTSADHVDIEDEASLARFAHSVEILPSANSAFKDIIPSRLPHLPHVQSEPILSLEHLMHHDCQGRMVQVKHLYKSESSILKQLGLASGDTEPEKSQVQYSPETHFRPIMSQKNSKEATPTNGNDGGVSHVQQTLCNIFSINIPTPDAQFSNQLYGRSSVYQVYQGMETETDDVKTFVPRFLIRKGLEKYIQTGVEDLCEEEVKQNDKEEELQVPKEPSPKPPSPILEETPDAQVEIEKDSPSEHMLEMLLNDMQDMLQLDEDEAHKFVVEDMHNYEFFAESPTSGQENSSDYESMIHDISTDDLSTANIAELWNEEESLSAATPTQTLPCTSMYKSIWSYGTEDDIPSVPGSYNTGPELNFEVLGQPFQSHEPWSTTNADTSWTAKPTILGNQQASDLEKRWAAKPDDVFCDDDSEDDVNVIIKGQLAHNQVLYSRELEQEWLNSDNIFEIQVPKSKEKKSGQRKPCSFFLEGNCRRTDCKFAHDTSTITCRFWEEGECFKGITCPFLHGYPSDSPVAEEKSSDSDFQLDCDEFPELMNTSSLSEGSPKLVPRSARGMLRIRQTRKSESDKNLASYLSSRKHTDKEKKRSKSMTIDSKSKSK